MDYPFIRPQPSWSSLLFLERSSQTHPEVCFTDLQGISPSKILTVRLASMELGDTSTTQETGFQKQTWDWNSLNPFGLALLRWLWLLLYLLKFQKSPHGSTKHGLMRQYQVFPIVLPHFHSMYACLIMYVAICFYFLTIKNNDCWQFLHIYEIGRLLLCTHRVKACTGWQWACRRGHQCEQVCAGGEQSSAWRAGYRSAGQQLHSEGREDGKAGGDRLQRTLAIWEASRIKRWWEPRAGFEWAMDTLKQCFLWGVWRRSEQNGRGKEKEQGTCRGFRRLM